MPFREKRVSDTWSFSRLYNTLCSVSGWSQKQPLSSQRPPEKLSQNRSLSLWEGLWWDPRYFLVFLLTSSPMLGLGSEPEILSLSRDPPSTLLFLDLERSHSTTPSIYISFRWSLKAVNMSAKAERSCSVSPTQRM